MSGIVRGRLCWQSLFSLALSCLSCGNEDSAGHAQSGGAAGVGGGAGTGGAAGSGGAGGAGWQNPGCGAPQAFVATEFSQLKVEVDLTGFAEGSYSVTQSMTLRPDSAGNAITLFGAALLMGKASHGYEYDGQRATFCVEPFAAGEEVTLAAEFTVSNSHQNFPAGNLSGIHAWPATGGSVIAAYSAPFFSATWLLAPQTMTWVQPEQDGNATVESASLSLTVPDASWSVVGPGLPSVKGTRWDFSVAGRMPLFSLAFAASPHFVSVAGVETAGGLDLLARVLPAAQTKVDRHLKAAAAGVDWMEASIAPYPWSTALTFAEIPGYPGGFEHTSGVWLGSSVIDGGDFGDYVAVHEAVHHWWGNDVIIADWPHFWLSEGLTDWTTVFGILPALNPSYAASQQKKYREEAAALSYPKPGSTTSPGPLRFADDDGFATQLGENGVFFYRYGAAFLEMVNRRLERDHQTSLTAVLKKWFAQKQRKLVTTEQFRDFLATEAGPATDWVKLFEQWVYATPCPTLELSNFSFAAGLASFDIERTGGLGQDLTDVELEISPSTQPAQSLALPKGVNKVSVSVPSKTAPTAIAVDPKGFYVLRLRTAPGWSGPSVQNTLP